MEKRRYLTAISLFISLVVILTSCGNAGGGGDMPTYTVGGTVNGLAPGELVVLQNNGGDDLTVAQNGLVFFTALADGSSYNVTVRTQPTGQTCTASNNTGTISGADVVDVAVECYNASTFDTTFDGDVIVEDHDNAASGNGSDSDRSITTDSDGKVLVTGYCYNGSDNDMVIWRYNSDGTLDTTFDGDGIVVHDNAAGGNGSDYGNSITTDSDGKILVTGSSENGSDFDMIIWRYNSDGTLDTTFDGYGIVVDSP